MSNEVIERTNDDAPAHCPEGRRADASAVEAAARAMPALLSQRAG
jgi:hypothetical protein